MAICKSCGDETDELVTLIISGKRRRVCDDCAAEARTQDDIAEQSEAAVQQLLGFKGRRS
jgi:ribosome-binding protein aMBF1 (putative translation factor)